MSSPITISFTDGNNTLREIQTAMSYSFVVSEQSCDCHMLTIRILCDCHVILQDVTLTLVEPSSGIASGGTVLTLTGPSLVYGSRHKVELELETGTKLPCSIKYAHSLSKSSYCMIMTHMVHM